MLAMASAGLVMFIRWVESDERLEPVVAHVHGLVSSTASRLGVSDLLSGSALGHPAHPLLVSMPIGCFTSAMIADLLGQRDAARTLTGAGVLCAVPTAATGLSDWADTADAERRVGFLHLTANTVAVSLYAASWYARRRGLDGRGQALGLAGAAVMTVAGWLGGHLAYGMGVGVDTTAFQGGPTEWTEIARPGRARAVGRAPTASRWRYWRTGTASHACSPTGACAERAELPRLLSGTGKSVGRGGLSRWWRGVTRRRPASLP